MARQTLGDFMRNIDFQKTKMDNDYSDSSQNPRDQLMVFVNEFREELTFEEVKDAFAVLVQKVAIKNYPGKFSPDPKYFTGTHFLAEDAAEILTKIMRRIVEAADDPSVTAAAGEVLLQTWMSVAAVGPHSTHLVVMDVLALKSKPTMKQYLPGILSTELTLAVLSKIQACGCTAPEDIGL